MPFAIKELSGVLATKSQVLWHASKKLQHLSKMIVILVIVVALSRLEWKVTSDHLEHCACKRPNIS